MQDSAAVSSQVLLKSTWEGVEGGREEWEKGRGESGGGGDLGEERRQQ